MKTRHILASSLFTLFAAHVASAASGTWTATTGSPASWPLATNWLNGVVADGQDNVADFSSVNLPAGAYTVNLDGSRVIGGLNFGDTDISSSGNWLLGTGTAGSVLTLRTTTGVAPVINVNQLGSATPRIGITAVLTGSQGFTKTGAGGMTLSTASTFTAGSVVTLNDGVLLLNVTGGGLGSASLRLNGGTLDSNISNLTLSGNPTQTWAGDFTFQGTQSLNLGTGAVSVLGDRTLNVNASSLTVGGQITTAAGSTFTKIGNGSLVLSAANAFGSGSVFNHTAGTLALNNSAALGAATLNISGGTINNTSSAAVTLAATPQTWSGDFTFQGSQALNLGTGAITLTGDRQVNVNASTLTVGGAISSSVAGSSFTKTGAGTLTLNAATNYTGATNLQAGTLILNGANNYAGGTIVTGGLLRFGTSSTVPTTGQITINGSGTMEATGPAGFTSASLWLSSGKIATSSTGSLILLANEGNALNLSAYTGLFLVPSGNRTISGLITPSDAFRLGGGTSVLTVSSNLSGAVPLIANGSLTLSGTNTYTGGTTINAGTLTFASTSNSVPSTGQVTLAGTSTLIAQGPSGSANATNWLQSGKLSTASTGSLALTALDANTSIDATGYNNLFISASTAVTVNNVTQQNGYRLGGGSVLTVNGNLTAPQGLTLGSSGTVILNGNNSYTGITNVPTGVTLRISHGNGLGSPEGQTFVANGGQLQVTGGITVNEPINIVGQGIGSVGAINNLSGNNTWAGTIKIDATGARIGSSSGTLNITGIIDDGGLGGLATGVVVRNASGVDGSTVRLSAENRFNGNSEIVIGTLQLGLGSINDGVMALPNANITMGNNSGQGGAATLDLNGYDLFAANIAPVTDNSIAVRVVNTNPNKTGQLYIYHQSSISTGVTTTSPARFGLVYGNKDATTGAPTQNNFAIIKGGATVYTMETESTYNGGTTINQGSIVAGINGALGRGNVTVTGFDVGTKLTIRTGVLDAIADSAILTLDGGMEADKADSGFLEFGLAGVGGAGIVETVGGLILGGTVMPFGTYGSLTSSAQFKYAEYFAGDGILRVVPEPGSFVTLVAGLGALGGLRRFRRHRTC